MNDRFDSDDEIVDLLRSTDPGEPPVTLGPGSALRHRAAVRHARRQAVGAGLAVALIGIAVAGSVVGTRHHTATTTASHPPIPSRSIATTADESPARSTAPSSAPATQSTVAISAPTPSRRSETQRPNTQSASPTVPKVLSAYVRDVGPVIVGQPVFFTVRYTAQGSVAANAIFTDFGDSATAGGVQTCTAYADAPTSTGSATSFESSTPSHWYAAPGIYTVRVTLSFGCITGAQPVVVSGTVVVAPAPANPSAPSASTSPSASATPSAPESDSPSPTP